MSVQRAELRLPDLDLPETVVTACSWHAAVGARVVEGDRLLEVLAGEVTVDLPAPASGRLVKRCVEIDEVLKVDQLLAVIEVQ
jgi:Pyruvate/2-oxoglutarate dehydrogenase complex, dihydrolipoamide acyltransferase (E2) component, and related enzymes